MTINTIITGAASGLGQALAQTLDDSNRHLFLLDTSIEGLHQTKDTIDYAQVDLLKIDITNFDAIEKWLQSITEVHELYNCAGVSITAGALDLSIENWTSIITVNVLGTIHISTLVAKNMEQNGRGTIVNIASMFAYLPAPSGIAYSTTKHALVGFTRTLEIELQESGVSVHLVIPGFIRTNLFKNSQYVGVHKKDCEPETKKMTSAKHAAVQIIRGISKNQRTIVFPLYVRLLYWLDWFLPSMTYYIWRQQWKKFTEIRDAKSR